MLYGIVLRGLRRAQIETWDGVVIKATPSFYWAIDRDIGPVLDWCNEHYLHWYLLPETKRSPALCVPKVNMRMINS